MSCAVVEVASPTRSQLALAPRVAPLCSSKRLYYIATQHEPAHHRGGAARQQKQQRRARELGRRHPGGRGAIGTSAR